MQAIFATAAPSAYSWLLVGALGIAVFAVVSALDAYQRARRISVRAP